MPFEGDANCSVLGHLDPGDTLLGVRSQTLDAYSRIGLIIALQTFFDLAYLLVSPLEHKNLARFGTHVMDVSVLSDIT